MFSLFFLEMRMDVVRVALVDDHSIVIEGLKVILRKHPWIEIVGEARCGITALELVGQSMPDVIILDLNLPGLHGLEVSQKIKQKSPQTKIIAHFGAFSNMMVRYGMQNGILGFVDKESGFEEMHRAIEAVSQGEQYLCKRVRTHLASAFRENLMEGTSGNTLISEDREMIKLLTDGKSVNEIAFYFNKSPKTIDARRRKIMNNLGFSNLADLTKYAIKEGITPLD